MGAPGPRPDIMPDPLRSDPVMAPPAPVFAEDIAPAPAPVPTPDPVESDWAWTVHSDPRTRLRAGTAVLVPSRRLFHMAAVPYRETAPSPTGPEIPLDRDLSCCAVSCVP